ncbi:hypothetical protein N7489_009854 [Penicillium chrysogenum]|uniref:Uncharacterized protein n=1 Tax=Penicillium chrysogenum TaxID=5076 RepID=A0ABQ8WVA8_PENCH|nr:hypothetical protein N7489_009854 [Penicillium chrysogenum]KAJ5258547.1 hypothetical protein N7524_010103 [Penicillium chrysogenum]KAJ5282974.1 hypothetical protein N7505_000954 [Penicillium chrysogenum]KAJ5838874.1 hypothetical protein N7525_004062 [Penicillium rubens]KAJ5866925.1 hypothetical protein N7534_001478 [Penicillium rubens]
MLCTAKRHST